LLPNNQFYCTSTASLLFGSLKFCWRVCLTYHSVIVLIILHYFNHKDVDRMRKAMHLRIQQMMGGGGEKNGIAFYANVSGEA